jgi:enamine deaminase RidA (YjgF/YER057c/UK114 family)
VERRTISGHAPMEAGIGYSRADVAGGHGSVAGTAPIPADGSDPPEGAYEQARLCLEIVLGALEQAGATAEDVVRTRIFVVPGTDFAEVGRAHAEVFREIRPATTGIVVAELLDPRWLVEIEVEALIG